MLEFMRKGMQHTIQCAECTVMLYSQSNTILWHCVPLFYLLSRAACYTDLHDVVMIGPLILNLFKTTSCGLALHDLNFTIQMQVTFIHFVHSIGKRVHLDMAPLPYCHLSLNQPND